MDPGTSGYDSAWTGQTLDDAAAGRRERTAQAARERLGGLSSRSRSVAGTTRTRVAPLAETTQQRFQQSREQLQQRRQEQQPSPWAIIAVLAAVLGLLAFVAIRRSRQLSEELDDIDILMAVDMPTANATGPMSRDGFDQIATTS